MVSVSQANVSAFFRAASDVIPPDRIFPNEEDRMAYDDQMAFPADTFRPAGAIAPISVEEVQALVRIANATKTPIWPISRGKNLGYGGSAPVMAGSVIMDMSRMNRIIEIDKDRAYCLIEPGVGFYDLYDALTQKGMPLWMSVPGNAWGSVAGNALERGKGPQPYGDHGAAICGLEVVLPDGSLIRTGTGAMDGSKTWNLSKDIYGPAWDQMFCQSNFGIVTKLGLWLMPAPEATMTLNLQLPDAGDLRRGVDMLYPLRLRGLIDHDPAWVSYVGIASYAGARSNWYDGDGLLPENKGQEIRKQLGIGWWNCQLNFYGHEKVIAAKCDAVIDAIQKHFPTKLTPTIWRQGDNFAGSKAGIPGTLDMAMINWYGGRGGHMGFSPILPADGKTAQAQFERTRKCYQDAGIDYYGAFAVGGRSVININEILYDRDDERMAKAVPELMRHLITDAAVQGYSEYRTHIDTMDQVAKTLNFGAGAMGRLNHAVKDALDPNGILAPGKSGIWPARYRS